MQHLLCPLSSFRWSGGCIIQSNACRWPERGRDRRRYFRAATLPTVLLKLPTHPNAQLLPLYVLEAPVTFRKCLVPCMFLRVYPCLTFLRHLRGRRSMLTINVSASCRDSHGSPCPAAAVGKMLHAEQQRHPGLEDNYSPGPVVGRLRAGARWRQWWTLPGVLNKYLQMRCMEFIEIWSCILA